MKTKRLDARSGDSPNHNLAKTVISIHNQDNLIVKHKTVSHSRKKEKKSYSRHVVCKNSASSVPANAPILNPDPFYGSDVLKEAVESWLEFEKKYIKGKNSSLAV